MNQNQKQEKKYSPDGGENWYDYEGPITVEENTEIIAKLEDEDGQSGEEQTLEITNIDKILPKIIIDPEQTGINNKAILTITIEEGQSGLAETNEYKYYLSTNSSTEEGGEWTEYVPGEEFTIGENITGIRYIFVKEVKDKAGNTATETLKAGPYIFDNTIPEIKEMKVIAPETGTYKAGEKITIEISWSENITVLQAPELILKFGEGEERKATHTEVNGSIMKYEYTIEQGDNGNLSLVDYRGGIVTDGINIATPEIKELGGNKITADTEGPKVEITPEEGEAIQERSITITVTDNIIGLSETNEYEYYLSTNPSAAEGGEWIEYRSGEGFTIGTGITGTRYIIVKQIEDKLGNKTEEQIITGPYIFDNTRPEIEKIEITTPETGIYKAGETITLEVTYTENVYGTKTKEEITEETANKIRI